MNRCEVCGCKVKVVGDTTKHYEIPQKKDIDEVVCNWSMDTGTDLHDSGVIDELVDRIAWLFGVEVEN